MEINRILTGISLRGWERYRESSLLSNASNRRLFFGTTRRWLAAVNTIPTEDPLLGRSSEGDRAKASSMLDESLAISSELGMRPLIERVLSRREILKA